MNHHFLLINNSPERFWLRVLAEVLAPFGTLEVEPEDRAIELIFREDYSLIIVDATLVEDVTLLITRIREERPDARIVIATSAPEWRRARAAFQVGAADYVEKSMSVNEMSEALANILTDITRHGNTFPTEKETPMPRATILFVDNDLAFLSARKELLESLGYHVITATNAAEAKQILEDVHIDLAILDIRLVNDEDAKDQTGLDLAREAGQSVPKIILTAHPTSDNVREALRTSLDGIQLAVDVVWKLEDVEMLHRLVRGVLNRRIFIVHGRDDAMKDTVARFIEKLGLWAIILHEQAGGGRTIIEKFEDYSNVGFAIALLTPDDLGRLKDPPQELRPRARQNVIFELGYFIGKLGRGRVCALYSEDVELPSDYHGIEYLLVDKNNSWKLSLAKEIKRAGISIDLNKAL